MQAVVIVMFAIFVRPIPYSSSTNVDNGMPSAVGVGLLVLVGTYALR